MDESDKVPLRSVATRRVSATAEVPKKGAKVLKKGMKNLDANTEYLEDKRKAFKVLLWFNAFVIYALWLKLVLPESVDSSRSFFGILGRDSVVGFVKMVPVIIAYMVPMVVAVYLPIHACYYIKEKRFLLWRFFLFEISATIPFIICSILFKVVPVVKYISVILVAIHLID